MGSWKKRIEDEVRKKYIMTDPLLKKGHIHRDPDFIPAAVCRYCNGYGMLPNGFTNENEVCKACEGTGEIYE